VSFCVKGLLFLLYLKEREDPCYICGALIGLKCKTKSVTIVIIYMSFNAMTFLAMLTLC
jgi:hypothetical protein